MSHKHSSRTYDQHEYFEIRRIVAQLWNSGQTLKSGRLTKDPNKGAAIFEYFASGIQHDAQLTTLELGKIGNSLRTLQSDNIAVVTVPANSRREDNGAVKVDFDRDAGPALKQALAGTDLPDFFRYLVSLGY